MKKWLLLVLCLICPVFADSLLDGVGEFGWDFFQVSAELGENTIFSPYSIYSCMAMTAAGAQGKTLKEMKKVMHFPSNFTKLSEALSANNASLQQNLKIANSLWIAPQFSIRADFRKTIEDNFHASVQSVDFSMPQTVDTINTWTAEKTDQKITDLLSSGDVDASTRLLLTNALYFSGKFLKPFNPQSTTSQDFWIGNDSTIAIPMMEQIGSFFYAEDDIFQTIALPLEATQVALLVFLPKEKTFSGLASKLTLKKFQKTLESLKIDRIHLKFPKFTLKQRFDLNQVLSQMGLSNAFSAEANFSGIDGKKDLYLSKVVHEAYFAVDENGIVAAAATAASIGVKSTLQQTSRTFFADHPFIYALVDLQTQVPFFIGELNTPP